MQKNRATSCYWISLAILVNSGNKPQASSPCMYTQYEDDVCIFAEMKKIDNFKNTRYACTCMYVQKSDRENCVSINMLSLHGFEYIKSEFPVHWNKIAHCSRFFLLS